LGGFTEITDRTDFKFELGIAVGAEAKGRGCSVRKGGKIGRRPEGMIMKNE
jgi:hypothetical protein